jgi:hypothetical protein
MTFRMFIFEDGGNLRRVPQRNAFGVFPEYAGRTVRYALVHLIATNRKPLAIRQVEAGYLTFDDRGSSQAASAESAIGLLGAWKGAKAEAIAATGGPIISATSRLAHKRLRDEGRWTPNPEELGRIEAVIWPRKRPCKTAV